MAVTEAEFRAAILPFTLHREGGLSLDRKDPGNWTGGTVGRGRLLGTKYGISAAAHPWLDVPALTIDEARAIYWRDYCVRPGFDRLTLGLLQVTFDAGVNCGCGRADAWLLATDGAPDEPARIRALSALNLAYHRRVRTWPRYGKVWGARIAAAERRALTLAAAAPVAIATPVAPPHPAAPRLAPQAEHQPEAGLVTLALRALVALLGPPHPTVKGAHP